MGQDKRLENERAHGKYLSEHGAGDIWNWTSPAGILRFKRRVEMLAGNLPENAEVLELGCGTGLFTKEFVIQPIKLTAIDISPELLDAAKQAVPADNVSFLVDNAYDMSFADNSFDAVIGSSVLHHLDIEQAFAEIYRVLRPGGVIRFTEPNMLNPQIALQKNIPWLKKRLGDSPDETAFFAGQLKRRLTKHGFKEVTITPFDFVHPSIPKTLFPIVLPCCSLAEKLPLIRAIAGSLYIQAGNPSVHFLK
jgi:ubiquinone/menaquinone biosynthesis C-methylase UbiE